jgi:hypothetical protein
MRERDFNQQVGLIELPVVAIPEHSHRPFGRSAERSR